MSEQIIKDVLIYGSLVRSLALGADCRPEFLDCVVIAPQPDGYTVSIKVFESVPGTLITQSKLSVGESIKARFHCVREGDILLSDCSAASSAETVSFAPDQLSFAPDLPGLSDHLDLVARSAKKAEKSDAEVAREASLLVRKYNGKRAVDLLPAPSRLSQTHTFRSGDVQAPVVIKELGQSITGYLRVSNERLAGRSAMLLYRGRCVGVINSDKSGELDILTSRLTGLLLEPDTLFSLCSAPPQMILPTATLMVGYPAVPDSQAKPDEAYRRYCQWLSNKEATGCIILRGRRAFTDVTLLVYFHEGRFCGAYQAESREFIEHESVLDELLASDPSIVVELSLLQREQIEAGTLGESLDFLIASANQG